MLEIYYLSEGNIQLSKHFYLSEFQCKNGDDKILVDKNLIQILEKLYSKLECSSIIVNSGYREPNYSLSVGGSLTDRHTKGQAADIKCYKGGKLIQSKYVCCAAEDLNIFGIGMINEYAVHIDSRESRYKWFGDERTGKSVNSWYTYTGVKRENNLTHKVGDVVRYNGIYATSNSSYKLKNKNDYGTITKIIKNALNPYLIDDIVGWINEDCIF